MPRAKKTKAAPPPGPEAPPHPGGAPDSVGVPNPSEPPNTTGHPVPLDEERRPLPD